MPALPVISGVWRCTLNWESNDAGSTHNVLHFLGPTSSFASFAQDLSDGFDVAALAHLASIFILNSVDILPLDGVTPQQHSVTTLGKVGGASGDPITTACSLIDLSTDQRGPRGRGRVFLGPIGESVQDSGALNNPGDVSQGWMDSIANWAGGNVGQLVVASYVHADSHDVVLASCRSRYGSQRRRMDQFL